MLHTVIPAVQKAEAGESHFKASLANLVRTHLEIKGKKGAGAVELLSMHKVLGSIPRTSQRKRSTTRKRREKLGFLS